MAALDSITGMPKLPITSAARAAIPSSPKGYMGPKEIAPIEEELGGEIVAAKQKVGEADINIEKAKREEKARELETKASGLEKFSQEVEQMPEKLALTELRKQQQGMEFIPTKDTAQDIAGLFSLVSVVGMVLGRKNAQGAMSAMNGMLEGYEKGRQDLFKKEASEFDRNFKAMQTKVTSALAEFQEALKIRQTNKEAGELREQAALSRMESPLLKAIYDKQGPVAVVERLQEIKKTTTETMPKLINDLQKARDDRELKAEMMRLKAGGGDGKQLKAKELTKIEGMDSIANSLDKLKKEFKPEYASLGVLGFGADISLEAKRRLGDEKGREAVSWWSRYQQLQAPNRHALFGATLTGNELKNYQSFTAKPGDAPNTVRDFLTDQINYTRDTADGTRRSFESAGYKVPETPPVDFESTYKGDVSPPVQNIQQDAVSRFGAYEPDKYDYGYEDGKFYRDKK
jgi:hypothetical protein